jgi:hypothetical protein
MRERLAAPRASLVPEGAREAQHDLRLTGLALAACEKAVQIVYETTLRPPEKQHAWWLDRVRGQLGAALATLEAELARAPLAPVARASRRPASPTAVVWEFTQSMLAERSSPPAHPALVAHAARGRGAARVSAPAAALSGQRGRRRRSARREQHRLDPPVQRRVRHRSRPVTSWAKLSASTSSGWRM